MPKPVKIVLITLAIALVFIYGAYILIHAIGAGAFNSMDPREIITYQSPDGEYSLVFEQIGDPVWSFGPVEVQLTLQTRDGQTIRQVSTQVHNDGSDADEYNVPSVSWKEDAVLVILKDHEGSRKQEISISYTKD